MAYGWEGDLVRLVPLNLERHFDNALKWLNDPEVTEYLLIGDFPLADAQERDYFDRMMKAPAEDIAFAIETLEGAHLGFSGIHAISYRHGFATTGTIIGAKDLWGKGYGTDAARVRARYCFDVVGLRMLYSAVLEGNERSLRMQKAVGYQQCGVRPMKYWKRGKYRDEVQTFLSRENLK